MVGLNFSKQKKSRLKKVNRYPYPCILQDSGPSYNDEKTLDCVHAQQHILNTVFLIYIREFDEMQW